MIFEGGANSEFDVRMTSTLFPEFASAVNPISGGNKRRVADLYEVLERVRRSGTLPVKVYAISDNDGETRSNPSIPQQVQWDVYHIENYLLKSEYIRRVLKEINALPSEMDSNEAILSSLRLCAEETVPQLVAHRLRTIANAKIIACLDLKFDPNSTDAAKAMFEAIGRSIERIKGQVNDNLSAGNLDQVAKQFTQEAQSQLQSGDWISQFRGRDILGRFVGRYAKRLPYENFRDFIIARMRDAGHEPPGMKRILEKIMNDPWDNPER